MRLWLRKMRLSNCFSIIAWPNFIDFEIAIHQSLGISERAEVDLENKAGLDKFIFSCIRVSGDHHRTLHGDRARCWKSNNVCSTAIIISDADDRREWLTRPRSGQSGIWFSFIWATVLAFWSGFICCYSTENIRHWREHISGGLASVEAFFHFGIHV